MENASKALLIAGAILIVIILIGIGVAVINSTGNVQDQASSSANSMEVQAFNAQFTPYLGDSISYNQVRKLLSVMKASNSANGYVSNFIDGSEDAGKDKYVFMSGKGMWEQDLMGDTIKYDVSVDEYTDNGYVKTILFLPEE